MKLDDHHPFTGIAVSDDDISQQSSLVPEVEERDTIFCGIFVDGITYLVVEVIHQMTFLDGQDLVECSCDMETDGWNVLQTLRFVIGQCLYLLFRQIAFVGTSEIQFVTIFLYLCTP